MEMKKGKERETIKSTAVIGMRSILGDFKKLLERQCQWDIWHRMNVYQTNVRQS